MIYKRGSRGEMVRQIQKALAGAGLKVIADGIFGAITEEAVREFQRKKGLKVDGIVGPATLALLIPTRLKKSSRTINEIIIHCTATPEGREVKMSEIRQWHKARGFSDVGYHYVIHLDGMIEPGRDVDLVGAHCTGHNTHSIGVCYVGGMDSANKKTKDTRTLKQKDALKKHIGFLKELYPRATVHGHNEYANKSCPCFDVKSEF